MENHSDLLLLHYMKGVNKDQKKNFWKELKLACIKKTNIKS